MHTIHNTPKNIPYIYISSKLIRYSAPVGCYACLRGYILKHLVRFSPLCAFNLLQMMCCLNFNEEDFVLRLIALYSKVTYLTS